MYYTLYRSGGLRAICKLTQSGKSNLSVKNGGNERKTGVQLEVGMCEQEVAAEDELHMSFCCY